MYTAFWKIDDHASAHSSLVLHAESAAGSESRDSSRTCLMWCTVLHMVLSARFAGECIFSKHSANSVNQISTYAGRKVRIVRQATSVPSTFKTPPKEA